MPVLSLLSLCFEKRTPSTIIGMVSEIAMVREHYETLPREQLMKLLPDRGWISIGGYARQVLGMKRIQAENVLSVGSGNGVMPDRELSYADLAFMQSKGIPFDARSTNWEVQY